MTVSWGRERGGRLRQPPPPNPASYATGYRAQPETVVARQGVLRSCVLRTTLRCGGPKPLRLRLQGKVIVPELWMTASAAVLTRPVPPPVAPANRPVPST